MGATTVVLQMGGRNGFSDGFLACEVLRQIVRPDGVTAGPSRLDPVTGG
jgi:hypothetical protein